MANPEHLAMIQKGVKAWNEWRGQNSDIDAYLTIDVDLTRADLSAANLFKADLHKADLSGANLSTTNLRYADLKGVSLNEANLRGADLSGADLWSADLIGADLSGADLSAANLYVADLRKADLRKADLSEAKLFEADLIGASLSAANLSEADLSHAKLTEADLSSADLREASLSGANLVGANLSMANLFKANLFVANLSGANLTGADLRSATLQHASLDEAKATGIKLWETQRAGWSIKGIICERAFWDGVAKEPTEYAPGEFERLYSDQTCIELFYEGGVSTFELDTLPALLHHLASLHPDTDIRLKSIVETGGGAKISISVGDARPEAVEKIKADAMHVYHAQLALRDEETKRLQIEKDYIERLFFGKLIPAMLAAGTPQNVFQGPVTGVVIASGQSNVDFHQTVNDNTALLTLLGKMMEHRADLMLAPHEAATLKSELQSAIAELHAENSDKTILSKSLGFIQKLATEAATKAAGKLGEAAIADWQSWVHQLAQFAHHLK